MQEKSRVEFVSLAWYVTDVQLEGLCSPYGKVSSIRFEEEPANGKSRGTAQVEFAAPESAASLLRDAATLPLLGGKQPQVRVPPETAPVVTIPATASPLLQRPAEPESQPQRLHAPPGWAPPPWAAGHPPWGGVPGAVEKMQRGEDHRRPPSRRSRSRSREKSRKHKHHKHRRSSRSRSRDKQKPTSAK